ncbi:MAG: hypothetical protein ACFE8N_03745 [Promethearchaeota archaeon]
MMMNNLKKYWLHKKTLSPELDDEEYSISDGCCFFHDKDELRSFSDIDDETTALKKSIEADEEEIKDFGTSDELEDYL